MKKVVVHQAGGHDQLRLEEHPVPEPGAGEVRVEAEAIGVNFADCIVRMGLYQSAKDYVGWPITPGFEAAGRVAALGEGVDDLAVGDEVFLVTRFGGYAEQIVAPRRQVFLRPEAMNPSEAASFPSVFLTASYALFELGAAREGQVMLVHSAAGGVGGALCQLGKAIGCRVVGVVGGTHKVETARKAGADVVIDKSKEDLWAAAESAAPSGYDLVFDANGVATLKQS
ncbi:MAG: alcohol dehydrogenase catalytic domain-containing protein, partial [Planctomycetota bacterium]